MIYLNLVVCFYSLHFFKSTYLIVIEVKTINIKYNFFIMYILYRIFNGFSFSRLMLLILVLDYF